MHAAEEREGEGGGQGGVGGGGMVRGEAGLEGEFTAVQAVIPQSAESKSQPCSPCPRIRRRHTRSTHLRATQQHRDDAPRTCVL